MSNKRELAKIAREIKSIKAQLRSAAPSELGGDWWDNPKLQKDFYKRVSSNYNFLDWSFENGLFTAIFGRETFIHIDFVNEFIGIDNEVDTGFRVVGDYRKDAKTALDTLEDLYLSYERMQ